MPEADTARAGTERGSPRQLASRTASVSAQVNHMIVVNIPFDFTVIDKHLTAGTYTLTSETSQSPFLIHGEQGGSAMFVLGFPARARKIQEDAKLVFNRYGDQYFLSKIWYPEVSLCSGR
jgi:hypothetical protein